MQIRMDSLQQQFLSNEVTEIFNAVIHYMGSNPTPGISGICKRFMCLRHIKCKTLIKDKREQIYSLLLGNFFSFWIHKDKEFPVNVIEKVILFNETTVVSSMVKKFIPSGT